MSIWRPWGNITWILDKLRIDTWAFLGCLSTEERCTAALPIFKDKLIKARLWQVDDPPSYYDNLAGERLKERNRSLTTLNINNYDVDHYHLFDRTDNIVHGCESFINNATNVALDITPFPPPPL